MLRKTIEFFQQYQPISLTGVPRHAFMWMTSSFNDVVYHNPHYQFPQKEDAIAIYCVHGTVDRSSAFSLIASRLLPELPDDISSIHSVAFSEFIHTENIESMAQELLGKIKSNYHKNLILIGHSRGGLIISYLDACLAKAAGINVCAVINICSPFAGSKLAAWPWSSLLASVKEMEIASDFLKGLSEKIIQSPSRYYYFAAENDSVVTPEASCIKEHKAALIILDRHGHISILSSHRLVNYLKQCVMEAVTFAFKDKTLKSILL